MNFRIKAKLILRVSGGKRRSSTQEVVRKKKLVRCFKKWESYISVLKKKKKKKKKKAPSDIFFSMGYGLLIAKEPLF